MSSTPGPADQLAFLHALCDRLPNGVVYQAVGRPGEPLRFLYVSAGVERSLGVTPAAVLADPGVLFGGILPDDWPAVKAALDAAARTGAEADYEYRHRAADGSVRWIRCRALPAPLPDGDFLWSGMALDVTDERRAADALAAGEARFRAFMNHTPAIAWMKDAAGRYVYASEPFTRRFGIGPEDWLGKTDFDVWPADMARDIWANDLRALEENQTVEAVETSYEANGVVSKWWVFKFPVTDGAGRRFVGGLAVEVTERERVRATLQRKNEELQAALDKVQRLEQSLVTMCAWTRTVRMGDRWVPVEEYLQATFGVRVSHGISDDALRKMQAEIE